MGLQTCGGESELRKAFQTVQSRGAALFKNAGVFLERYYPAAHHIEVQVFGNGQGKVAALGERECSIQRRHQKVIEECPSPFVAQKRPDLRRQLCDAAISLAESVKYASAGTLEFLVDDESGAFFFLEMNTRLQVEHGVTEMVYGVDLVELMLRQVDAQMAGKGGLEQAEVEDISKSCQEPKGHAIEVRVYAENPARDYAPSPGLLQEVIFHELPGTRIDGWVRAGITISPHYGKLGKALPHAQLLTISPRSAVGESAAACAKQIAGCRGAQDGALKDINMRPPYESRFSSCNSQVSRIRGWKHDYTVSVHLCVPPSGNRRASWRLLYSRRRLSRSPNHRQGLRARGSDGPDIFPNRQRSCWQSSWKGGVGNHPDRTRPQVPGGCYSISHGCSHLRHTRWQGVSHVAEGKNICRAAPGYRQDLVQRRMQVLPCGIRWLSECCRVVWIQGNRTANIGRWVSRSSDSNGQSIFMHFQSQSLELFVKTDAQSLTGRHTSHRRYTSS